MLDFDVDQLHTKHFVPKGNVGCILKMHFASHCICDVLDLFRAVHSILFSSMTGTDYFSVPFCSIFYAL